MTESSKPSRRLPSTFYNVTSMVGVGLAGASLGLIVFLFALEFTAERPNPYMGIVAFVILPVFLFLGVGLVILGIFVEWWRRRHGRPATKRLPYFDLNDPRQRHAFVLSAIAIVLLLAFSAFGSFQAYEYTESNAFCGTVCHTVMHPEYTTHEESPHARVDCVRCHIGPGAQWWVRSKLSGAYQVYAALFDKYPRPIPSPIEDLRPVGANCKECHWPAYFVGEKLVVHDYYLPDEANTHMRLNLLLKIGGGDPQGGGGGGSGIHWHMYVENRVEFVATDEARLQIPWVRVTRPDGKVTVYRDQESDFSEKDLADHEIRTFDCIDCHNRPSHNYHPPYGQVNALLAARRIDPALPFVKSVAVEALDAGYESTEAARSGIADHIRSFYREKHPEVLEAQSEAIEAAIREVQGVYARNYFPKMKVDWKHYPDHKGHLWSPGCFRCHDGNHANEEGEVLSRNCTTCHTLLAQETDHKGETVSLSGIEYQHPVDVGGAWQFMNCTDCHGG